MKVVLLKDVPNTGKKYETKDVSDGYGINYLIPQGLAKEGTVGNIKWAETALAKQDKEKNDKIEAASESVKQLAGKSVEIKAKINEKGHLFASLHKEDILSEVSKQLGLEIPQEILELEEPIKQAGTHKIEVNAGEEKAVLEVEVVAEDN